jgi:tetratricopeptide (TPR) repeat protein
MSAANFFRTLRSLDADRASRSRGRFARGVPHARASVRLRRRIHGARSAAVAADRAALAALLDEVGRRAEAERLYREVITFYRSRRATGAHRYDLAINLNNLAAIHAARGKSASARRLYRESIALLSGLLGPAHPEVGILLNNLGMLEADTGRPREALRLLRQAAGVLRCALGPRHQRLRECLANLKSLS